MTMYKHGDVVLVPFPFSDQTITKKRPAVVISSNAYNEVSSDLIIIAITSKIEGITAGIECLLIHKPLLMLAVLCGHTPLLRGKRGRI